MTDQQVTFERGQALVSELKTGRVVEYSLSIASFGEDAQIRIQRRSINGFHTIGVHRLHGLTISESRFQDIMTTFTSCVLDELITGKGVQLVLPFDPEG